MDKRIATASSEVSLEPGVELPFDGPSQRRVEKALRSLIGGESASGNVRPVVLESWSRSLAAGVAPELKKAPLVWSEEQLLLACEKSDWFSAAKQTLARQHGDHLEGGHILTLFDGRGRMLLSEGDPRAREGLSELNFRPGANWSEEAVGTNGPGTALALGRAVHVVGAEHFCERWHAWHCAAAPVRDPSTGAVLAIVDISGFREMGHPHTLRLASAIATAVEQRLAALGAERRVLLLQNFAQLAGRWPGEMLLAVDRSGVVLAATREPPASMTGLTGREHLRALLEANAIEAREQNKEESDLAISPELNALCRPIFDGHAHAGSCLVLRQSPPQVAPKITHAPRISKTTRYTLSDIMGQSPQIEKARATALAAARNALPVLLSGESGTGKEVFAQGIHAASARSTKRFVGVNCASLSRELVESEFFGYVGGAFSGARRDGSIGKFEAADGGTLFLDEIAELGPEAQAALLRVLQEGEVVPVGATQPRAVDVRIIAATNRDLHAALESGSLREDLFHRLNVLSIALPPLRERLADLPLLAAKFLEETEKEQHLAARPLSPELLAALQTFHWPGNVRELKNTLRRMVALAPGPRLELSDAPDEIRLDAEAEKEIAAAAPLIDAKENLPGASASLLENPALRRLIDTVASARTMTEAAHLLGVTRSTLYRQLARLGLRAERILRRQ